MKHKKILPKAHTGKLVHHRHTAYGALVGLLLLTVTPLFIISREVATAAPTDPVVASYGTYAVVPAQIPETPPNITAPGQGTVITTNDPVTVSGSCPDNMLIKVFKNDVLAGAVFCEGGRFGVEIDLFLGPNALVARAYNANNIAGPDSAVVTVRREMAGQPAGQTPVTPSSGQFFITSDIHYKGVSTGQKVTWPLIISGGQAPYAVSVSWGDGKTDLISRSQAGLFEVSHVYEKSGDGPHGSYDITVLATDGTGTKSFIHFVTIVSSNEPATVAASIKAGYNWSSALKIAWQLIVLAIAIIVSFWLGERREAFIIKRKLGSV